MADHFRNKTLRVIWPGAPGGDRALYVLPFIEFFGRHIPGNPTVVPTFMPGAGGAVGMNYLYNVAPPDGLTIATPFAPVAVAQLIGGSTVKYDLNEMAWIGRTADATGVFFMWDTVPVYTLDDLRKTQVVIASTGPASETFIEPAIMNQLLDTKFKIVLGYHAVVDAVMATESREADGAFTTWSDVRNYHQAWLQQKRIRIMYQIGLVKHPALPDVPLLTDLAANDADREVIAFMSSSSQIGQAFVAPPGAQASIIATLRQAFDETMKDPDFLASVEKQKLEINPMGGAELTALVGKTLRGPKSIVERYRAAIAAQSAE